MLYAFLIVVSFVIARTFAALTQILFNIDGKLHKPTSQSAAGNNITQAPSVLRVCVLFQVLVKNLNFGIVLEKRNCQRHECRTVRPGLGSACAAVVAARRLDGSTAQQLSSTTAQQYSSACGYVSPADGDGLGRQQKQNCLNTFFFLFLKRKCQFTMSKIVLGICNRRWTYRCLGRSGGSPAYYQPLCIHMLIV